MSEPRWRVVYEDPHIVVVEKPFGMPSQSTRDGAPGLYESLQKHLSPGAAYYLTVQRTMMLHILTFVVDVPKHFAVQIQYRSSSHD